MTAAPYTTPAATHPVLAKRINASAHAARPWRLVIGRRTSRSMGGQPPSRAPKAPSTEARVTGLGWRHQVGPTAAAATGEFCKTRGFPVPPTRQYQVKFDDGSYTDADWVEPPRLSRRLQTLRGWSHGETKQVLPGTAGLDATVVVEQQNKHESPRAGDDDRRQLRMTPWARRAPESPVV